MKSFLLSLLLILCFGFSTQAVDQLDQTSKIVKEIHSHFELGFLSVEQDLQPKVKSPTEPLISFRKSIIPEVSQQLIRTTQNLLKVSHHSNFISSGASLVYHLSRAHA